MNTNRKKDTFARFDTLICLFLVAATCIIYLQVIHFDFINYDDGDYISGNPYVQKGLTKDTVIWAFTSYDASNWHPLTWLSHMMDVELFGMAPGYHHLMNVYFHILNTLLLFYIFFRTTRQVWQSAFVAALFATHPLHVESVAWISERKDILSTFFGFLAVALYIQYIRHQRIRDYVLTLLAFVLGLMSKPMLVTLPVILLLIDYWPLGRIQLDQISTFKDFFKALPGVYRFLKEKVFLFILVVLSCVVTFIAQQRGGAVGTFETYPIYTRLANAIVAYVIYLGKLFWPANLSVFYPHTRHIPIWQCIGAFLIILFILTMALKCYKKWPFFIVGWLWYLITLLPVIGIVQVGAQAYADRYTYIPSIGIFIIVAWGMAEFVKRFRIKPWLVGVSGAAVCIVLMQLSFTQISYWKNSNTLFSHSIDVSDKNYLAYNNLGCALSNQGHIAEAISHYEKAIEIYPIYTMAYCNLGISLLEQSRFQEGVDCFKTALQFNPKYHEAYYHMGYAYANQGLIKKAVTSFQTLFERVPDFKALNANYGLFLMQEGRHDEASVFFRNAIQLKSDFSIVKPDKMHDPPETAFEKAYVYHCNGEFEKAAGYYKKAIFQTGDQAGKTYLNYGALLAEMGRMAEGLVYLNKTLDTNYMPPELFNNFGVAQLKQEKLVEATRYLNEAVRRSSEFRSAYNNMGVVLAKQGRIPEAMEKFQTALTFDPQYVNALNNSGIIMSQQGAFKKALSFFEKSFGLNPENADTCYHLAAFYACQESPEKAIYWLRKAIDKGFNHFNLLENDVLLNNLKSLASYNDLITNIQAEDTR
ncbi:MAG: tetratricopeptide repeat protein [Proteobacteria bacterium]|nr:tetratricopeptide repeat protein [Pseudomonadota bacterium]